MKTVNLVTIDTDVLIIGGGLAGCMAAIKAAETKDLRVTLVDKSNTIASGCAAAGIDHLWAYIPPIHEKMGYSIEDMAEDHRVGGRGFLPKDLFMLVAGTIYERVLDSRERFGIKFGMKTARRRAGFGSCHSSIAFPHRSILTVRPYENQTDRKKQNAGESRLLIGFR